MNSSLETKLRQLLSEYSPKEVSDSLQGIFKRDYDFYTSYFGVQNSSVSAPTGEAPQPSAQREKKLVKKSQQLVVKRNTEEVKDFKLTGEALDDQEDIVPETLLKREDDSEDWLDEKQKQKEEETNQTLKEKGINPESLLTKDNLHDWVEVKKYNFAYIARELVGLSQAQVRYAAKAFNIQSPITKRRQGIIAKKAGKGKN